MRRSLETEESSETASLLNAPSTISADILVRELYTAKTLPARVAQSSLVGTQALDTVALQAAALELARREKIRQRGRAIETAVNGDGGPYQQFANVFETFAIALASGMAEDEALQLAARDAPDTIKVVFTEVAAQIEQGVPLVQALRKHEDMLPDIVIPIFEHGTIYGTAENASRQLARALKHLARVGEKFEYSALNPGMTIPLVAGGIMILALFSGFLNVREPTRALSDDMRCLLERFGAELEVPPQTSGAKSADFGNFAIGAEGYRQWVCAKAAKRGPLVPDVCRSMALWRTHQLRTGSGRAQHPQRLL